ncbi:MAG: glycosyltransferase family 4 protein [Armatimonadetes bacterium]|nr:glycosyltransferase family 4 protein [Armatimonadota bacterium]
MANRPIDIAVVIEHLGTGGGQERVARELVARWASRHKVTVYCYHAAEDMAALGVKTTPVRPAPRSKLLGAILFPRLVSRILAQHHDIILAQGGNCPRCNFSLFHTCHILRLETMRLVAVERGRPLTLRERLNMAARRLFFIPGERRTLLRCRGRAYAVSQRMAEDLRRVYGLGPQDVLVAPNGVELETFNPGVQVNRKPARAALGINEDDLLALFVGGLWWEKGLHIALRAVAAARWPWKLVVVGSHADEPAFRKLAADLGLAQRVLFCGRTDRPQDFYAAADCLLLPSRFEGFPLVSAEAAACGLPVLISREGNPGGLFEDGAGYILPREPQAFASALDELAAQPALRERMGAAAANRARLFTWDRQAEILEEGFYRYLART